MAFHVAKSNFRHFRSTRSAIIPTLQYMASVLQANSFSKLLFWRPSGPKWSPLYKMSLAKNKTIKLGKKRNHFSFVTPCANLHKDKTDKI